MKMKKLGSLLLCLVMLFSTMSIVSFAGEQETTIERVTLNRNTSYYSETVPTGTKLIVTAYDTDGNKVDVSGKNVTYSSSSPWVLDVDSEGTIVDGGYEGTTIVSVSVDGVTGKLVMIKAKDDGKTATRGFDTEDIKTVSMNPKTATTPYHLQAATGYFAISNTTSGHDSKKYLSANSGSDYFMYKGSWDNAANIRVGQIWFYDSGTADVGARLYANTPDPNTADYSSGAPNYLDAWKEIGIKPSMVVKSGQGFYYTAKIFADSSSENYLISVFDKTTVSEIKRTVGWHQATIIVNEDATATIYLDGEQVNDSTEKFKDNNAATAKLGFSVGSTTKGNFDDIVFAQKGYTEEPADYNKVKITVDCGEGGKVLYHDAETNEVSVKNGTQVQFAIAPDFGYEIDTITYDDNSIPVGNEVIVNAKETTLKVTFKLVTPKAPSIKTAVAMTTDNVMYGTEPAAITYMEIIPGSEDSTVKEAGILLGFDDVTKELKAYSSYTSESENTPVASGFFAIRVFGEAINNVPCTATPFVKYTRSDEDIMVEGDSTSFTIIK